MSDKRIKSCGLLYVAGCGGGDPFVGSWRDAEGSDDTRLVIAKVNDGYRVAHDERLGL